MNYAPEEDDVRPTDFVPAVPETGGWMNLYATGGGYPTIPHIHPVIDGFSTCLPTQREIHCG